VVTAFKHFDDQRLYLLTTSNTLHPSHSLFSSSSLRPLFQELSTSGEGEKRGILILEDKSMPQQQQPQNKEGFKFNKVGIILNCK